MFASLEAEFSAIVNDVKSVPEKLEALVGLHVKATAVAALAAPLTTILEDAAQTTEQKVEAILVAVGKL
jgi:hypothetical protein